jgi:formylglycine-generating enzyme required for sulfatase activity
MSGEKDKTTTVDSSQVGVVGEDARIDGDVHFGDKVRKHVINIQQVTIYRSDSPPPDEAPEAAKTDIGHNPYLGLGAFQEQDADRFFGREELTRTLWEKFRDLNDQGTIDKKIRLLPILGPSGSGKSSVARAGLIPELARNPLPGYARARVGIFTPGSDPVHALAGILARMLTGEAVPAKKAEEFEEILIKRCDKGKYDGLTRIARLFPDIQEAPLVILVDQFEEVYAYCDSQDESCQLHDKRDCFIGNLLQAASDAAGPVSVVLTLRSDFLGETQSSEDLNRAIAENGEIIPAMGRAELRLAIAKPAENAGHPFKDALVNNLVEQTRDREGALPLLQFALTRLWAGMADGQQPADTLEEINGVGGALAKEARRLYNNLPAEDQTIARRAFLGMVNLGEGIKDTRRRVSLDQVVAAGEDRARVKKVLEIFSGRNARLITLSGAEGAGGVQTAEMTHEALLEHWRDLKDWLRKTRDDMRLHRRLELAAKNWKAQKYPTGSLWRSPDLDLLRNLYRDPKIDFSKLEEKFYRASERALTKKRLLQASLAVLIGIGIGIGFYLVKQQERIAIRNQKNAIYNLARVYEEKAGFALRDALKGDNPDQNFQKAWLYTLEALNQDIPADKELPDSVKRLALKPLHLGLLRGAGDHADNRYQAFATADKTVRRWESDLATAYLNAGKEAPEFKAVYRCSFDLFPYKMEEISLVPVTDGPPGGSRPWYADYPRPAGQDPVQWMIESAAKAVRDKKLTLDGISPDWMAKFTAPDASRAASPGKTKEVVTLAPGVQMTFVCIPAGSFFMGSPLDESGRGSNEMFHMVTLTNVFYLQTTEVTQGLWQAVMGEGENPSDFTSCGADCPVEKVSWDMAQAFIKKLNAKEKGTYRLPTEAEWEYASRAGSTSAYGFGDDPAQLAEYAWYVQNAENKTHRVKGRAPNAWGLYDMHGNVWEWCQDVYAAYPSCDLADPQSCEVVDPKRSSGGANRVLRGGSWYGNAWICRSANRNRAGPDYRDRDLGFRLVFLPGQP